MKLNIVLSFVLLALFSLYSHCSASDQTSSMIANQQICHILEDSPSCAGIAPQKSQSADIPLRASLSIKNSQGLNSSSKTEINPRSLREELSGRIIKD